MNSLLKTFDKLWAQVQAFDGHPDDVQDFRAELTELEMIAESLAEEVDRLEDEITSIAEDDPNEIDSSNWDA